LTTGRGHVHVHTGLRCAVLEPCLEREPDALGQDGDRLGLVVTGSPDRDRIVRPHPAVATEVALLLAQRPQPLHGRQPYGTARTAQWTTLAGVNARAKSFDYAVSLDETWDARSDRGGGVLAGADEDAWTPEHLVLAGLARCTLTSLRYHCVRADVVLTARAAARGTVTKRAEDDRFALVEIVVEAEVSFDPKPDEAAVAELLAKGERDCFVGASLTASPTYVWRVA